jgi:TPR repeat protein
MKELRPTDAELYYALATAFGEGFGEEKDFAKAVHYLQLAVSLEYAPAIWFLGYCYAEGLGVSHKNYKKAVPLFAKAAEKGVVCGLTSLAYCYSHGQGVKQDKNKAFHLYLEAAEKGDEIAQFNVGLFLKKDWLVSKRICNKPLLGSLHPPKKAVRMHNTELDMPMLLGEGYPKNLEGQYCGIKKRRSRGYKTPFGILQCVI